MLSVKKLFAGSLFVAAMCEEGVEAVRLIRMQSVDEDGSPYGLVEIEAEVDQNDVANALSLVNEQFFQL